MARIGDKDKNQLDRLAAALDVMRSEIPNPTFNEIFTFLEVARSPGCGPAEYGRTLGLSVSAVSKNLFKLYDALRQYETIPLMLIEPTGDHTDRRLVKYHLTPKGEMLVHKILQHIRGPRYPAA